MRQFLIAVVIVLGGATYAASQTSVSLRPITRPQPVLPPSSAVVPPVLSADSDLGEKEADVAKVVELAVPKLSDITPPVRPAQLPRTRFQHQPDHAIWTRAALAALKSHGKPLVDMVPEDIADWCPAYQTSDEAGRRAFWVGFLSALSKHESTYKPYAVGGGGRWFGLLQILPATARGYNCVAGTGEALKNGAANLSCAIRIMAVTVPRDGVVYGPGGRGVAADWGPLRSEAKRSDMAQWLRRQAYCRPLNAIRPKSRP